MIPEVSHTGAMHNTDNGSLRLIPLNDTLAAHGIERPDDGRSSEQPNSTTFSNIDSFSQTDTTENNTIPTVAPSNPAPSTGSSDCSVHNQDRGSHTSDIVRERTSPSRILGYLNGDDIETVEFTTRAIRYRDHRSRGEIKFRGINPPWAETPWLPRADVQGTTREEAFKNNSDVLYAAEAYSLLGTSRTPLYEGVIQTSSNRSEDIGWKLLKETEDSKAIHGPNSYPLVVTYHDPSIQRRVRAVIDYTELQKLAKKDGGIWKETLDAVTTEAMETVKDDVNGMTAEFESVVQYENSADHVYQSLIEGKKGIDNKLQVMKCLHNTSGSS